MLICPILFICWKIIYVLDSYIICLLFLEDLIGMSQFKIIDDLIKASSLKVDLFSIIINAVVFDDKYPENSPDMYSCIQLHDIKHSNPWYIFICLRTHSLTHKSVGAANILMICRNMECLNIILPYYENFFYICHNCGRMEMDFKGYLLYIIMN